LVDKIKSSYLCSPIRKEMVAAVFLISVSSTFPFARESEKKEKRKKRKKLRKSLVVKLKPLTFAPAFETKAIQFFEILINNTSSTRKK